MTEIEPCPKCGALPCDWTDNPHTAPSGDAERYRRTAIDVAASLAAAISLLEKGGKAAKKAAASDRMFDQMLTDYRASLDRARAAIAYRTPSARITGDKDRENPVEGAPYGEGLIGRIDDLEAKLRATAIEAHRLRSCLRYIEGAGYADHQSGNANFEHLQGLARSALDDAHTARATENRHD